MQTLSWSRWGDGDDYAVDHGMVRGMVDGSWNTTPKWADFGPYPGPLFGSFQLSVGPRGIRGVHFGGPFGHYDPRTHNPYTRARVQ